MGVAAFVVNLICVALILVPAFQAMAGIVTFKVSMVVCPVIGLLGLVLSQKAVPFSVSRDILLLKKPSMSLFGALLMRFYQPILKEARDARIPVLDLPNTFNPYDDLYISGIEQAPRVPRSSRKESRTSWKIMILKKSKAWSTQKQMILMVAV